MLGRGRRRASGSEPKSNGSTPSVRANGDGTRKFPTERLRKPMSFEMTVLSDAKLLWDYHRLGATATTADAILGLGSYDLSVAKYAAQLFLENRAPWLAFAGGLVPRKDLLQTPWSQAEAYLFADCAREMGVLDDKLVVEARSMNTSENFRLALEALCERGVECGTLIVVMKPNMERRVRATAAVQVPRTITVTVTSPPTTFEQYIQTIDLSKLINLMVGDLQRIAGMGFQAVELIPAEVDASFHRLIKAGFTNHLIALPNNDVHR
jgi:hypothetical protein